MIPALNFGANATQTVQVKVNNDNHSLWGQLFERELQRLSTHYKRINKENVSAHIKFTVGANDKGTATVASKALQEIILSLKKENDSLEIIA